VSDASDFLKDMDDAEKLFDETPAASMDLIPDGIYQMCLVETEFFVQEKDDPVNGVVVKIPIAKLTWSIAEPGELENRSVIEWCRLNNRNGVKFFKEKLRQLGITQEFKFVDLEGILLDIKGCMARAKVSNKKGSQGDRVFTNIWVQEFLGKSTDGVTPF